MVMHQKNFSKEYIIVILGLVFDINLRPIPWAEFIFLGPKTDLSLSDIAFYSSGLCFCFQ